MLTLVSTLLGGIGLFLLGMILMSEGLKGAAGQALRGILERSTGTTVRAFASGAGITALVQSSSATIIATIGFVSAGLLTFASALGVIVGAAVGTTSTGWIVALLGLKFSAAAVAMPLVGVGALLRLLTGGRLAHVGMALAGFGLIFVGIEMLRAGMGGLAAPLDLAAIPSATLLGGLRLVLIGIVTTVVLQSSSAAIALSLTAVHTGAVGLEQAALLVIGQNVGTTVTSALAAFGGSTPARRTGVGHVLFNSFSGLVAFVAVGPLLAFSERVAHAAGSTEASVVIAVFHTVFNLAGAVIILPLLGPFARLLTRIIPEREPALTRHLDRTLVEIPSVAVEAATRTVIEVARIAVLEAQAKAAGETPSTARLEEARQALEATHRFLGRIRMSRDAREDMAQRLALLHASDHLGRMIRGLLQETPRRYNELPELQGAVRALVEAFREAEKWLQTREDGQAVVDALAAASAAQAALRREYRASLLRRTAAGGLQPEDAPARLEVMRQIDHLLYHGWRAMHHLVLPTSEEELALTDADMAPL